MKLTRQDFIEDRRQKDKNTLKKKGEQFLYNQLRRDFGHGKIYGVPIVEYVESLKKELSAESK